LVWFNGTVFFDSRSDEINQVNKTFKTQFAVIKSWMPGNLVKAGNELSVPIWLFFQMIIRTYIIERVVYKYKRFGSNSNGGRTSKKEASAAMKRDVIVTHPIV
jgi:hypothetical protein